MHPGFALPSLLGARAAMLRKMWVFPRRSPRGAHAIKAVAAKQAGGAYTTMMKPAREDRLAQAQHPPREGAIMPHTKVNACRTKRSWGMVPRYDRAERERGREGHSRSTGKRRAPGARKESRNGCCFSGRRYFFAGRIGDARSGGRWSGEQRRCINRSPARRRRRRSSTRATQKEIC